MLYRKGDVIYIASPGNDNKVESLGVIIQADWFNTCNPPSYIIGLLSSDVYPELDFRPIIKPDEKNNISSISQVVIDKLQTIKQVHILKRIGKLESKQMKEIQGCLKAMLGI